MWMTLPAHQFGWAFANAFGVIAAQKTTVIEKELQQRQVIIADMTTQEEVAAQAAVEVLDKRTGPDGAAA